MSNRTSLDKIQNIINNKKGILFTHTYINVNTILEIQCDKGHNWKTKYDNIRKGSWCPYCSNKKIKTIDDANFLAIKKGGICLSEKYINNKSKLKWKCMFGHIWDAAFNDINCDRWCPICASGTYEKICRLYFESIFNKKFIKIRPEWLKNIDNNNLELDGYCEELQIAFEHNGMQHYEQSNWFNNNLQKIQNHDLIKKQLCKERGIKLIIIPSLCSIIKIDNLKEFIKKMCIQESIPLPDKFDNIIIDFSLIYELDFITL